MMKKRSYQDIRLNVMVVCKYTHVHEKETNERGMGGEWGEGAGGGH